MRLHQVRYLAVAVTLLAVVALASCNQFLGGGGGGGAADGDGGGGGGDGDGDGNGVGDPGSGGLIDNGLQAPGPLADDVQNLPPGGELLFPVEGGSVAAGAVVFVWTAADGNETNVDTTIVISDQREVFDNQQTTLTVRTAPDEDEHRIEIDLDNVGTFYWGVEISDGVNTIRRPADGTGVSFQVTLSGIPPANLDAILLCPRSDLPAREQTTFDWSLGDLEPIKTTVFVSRSGLDNPFDSPLLVLEVIPPTETSQPLSESEALTIGDELSWGLRVETADRVLFSFEGQVGERFLVAENIPPDGLLDGPENDSRSPDGVLLELTWADNDGGNCEDPLTFTIFFEFLGDADQPQALFESAIQFEVQAATFEADLAAELGELDLQAGRWAWGVMADDGTDQVVIPDADNRDRNFRTFIRDPSPRFSPDPAVASRVCGTGAVGSEAISFGYDDDNGTDTVSVTLYYAVQQTDLFDNPTETLAFDPAAFGQTPEDAFVFVQPSDSPGCPEFVHGFGFYGVELSDGANEPVRHTVAFQESTQGACCALDGSCTDGPVSACVDGFYQGDGTTCAAASCIAQGACCAQDGGCTDGPQSECQTGLYAGDGTACATAQCGAPGACCAPDASCAEVLQSQCVNTSGLFQGDGTSCADVACIPRGACCAIDGSCTDATHPACTDGLYQGDGTTCATVQCVPRGACCRSDGSCVETEQANCTGTYQGDATSCTAVNCPPPAPIIGACCLLSGGCDEVVFGTCSGLYQGDGTSCTSVQCFIDCNSNGIEDFQDIADQDSLDCNNNLIPDECEGDPIVVEAGALDQGTIVNGGYDSIVPKNDLQGSICPPNLIAGVLWEIISVPAGLPAPPVVVIRSPTLLFSSYFINPAVPGDYVFQLTVFPEVGPISFDTVTLTLVP